MELESPRRVAKPPTYGVTLPNFLVLGAQKAGSSWFTQNLRQHPEVFMPLDELNFFAGGRFELGPEWYRDQFTAATGESRIGEGTPGYLYRERAPDRIAALLGTDVKLIASIRHPVDRAYSAFWRILAGGEIPADAEFLDYFDRDERGIRTRGDYAAQIARYRDRFPSGNLRVYVVENDLGANGATTLRDAYEFLGVDPLFRPESATRKANSTRDLSWGYSRLSQAGRSAARATIDWSPRLREPLRRSYLRAMKRLPVSRVHEPLDAEARQELFDKHYAADLPHLEELIDRDLRVWHER